MRPASARTTAIRVTTASLLLLIGCGGGGGGSSGSPPPPPPPPPVAPTVTLTAPLDNVTGQDPSIVVSATFSTAMDPATIDAASFTLSEAGGGLITGIVSSAGATATFTPGSDLKRLTSYTATLTTAITDTAGTALFADYTWDFTTRDWAWSTATLLESDNLADAINQSVAIDSNGNAMAMWSQNTAAGYHIWSARRVQGGSWGSPVQVDSATAYYVNMPRLGFDAAGNAVAVWQQFDGTRYNAWANRYVVGTGWGTPVPIETENLGDVQRPQVCVDSSGNAIAVWWQSDGTRGNVWTNRFEVGTGWGTAALLETSDYFVAQYPALAGNASGSAIAIWAQSDGTAQSIFVARYTAGGTWTAPAPAEVSSNVCQDPDLTIDSAGNAIAVWEEEYSGTWHINANRYVAGTGWQSSGQINLGTTTAVDPRIAGDTSGNACVVWRQYDTSGFFIHAIRYVAGTGWATATPIETIATSNTSLFPAVSVDESGNALVAWERSDGIRSNIYSNRYTAGSSWGSRVLIETNDAGGAYNVRIARNAVGYAAAVWEQSDGTRYNVWANWVD